jgi:hypothetical protein
MKKDDNILTAGGYPNKKKNRSPSLCVVFPAHMLFKIKKQAHQENITAGELIRRFCNHGLKRSIK